VSSKILILPSNYIKGKKKVKNIINNSKKPHQEEVFTDLLKKHQSSVYRMAFTYTKNKEDALDVLQETAYRAFLQFDSLKDLDYFKTWLIKISINCSIDLLRKRNREVNFEFDFEQIPQASYFTSEDLPLSLTLKDLLEVIDESDKTLLLLKYYQGFTFAEIADIIERPESTVKSLMYRALRKLRKKVRRDQLYEK
jgi:RNA polymerase sigma-70 factor, ECF subfamily